MIFPDDNTRKIIFQRNFFGQTIFSGRPKKENKVFRAVKKEKVEPFHMSIYQSNTYRKDLAKLAIFWR